MPIVTKSRHTQQQHMGKTWIGAAWRLRAPCGTRTVVMGENAMFYRIIREFNDGRLYYRGGAAGDGASWTEAPESARHYRSADQSVRIGATVAALVEAGRVGVEEIDSLPYAGSVYDEEAQHARAD